MYKIRYCGYGAVNSAGVRLKKQGIIGHPITTLEEICFSPMNGTVAAS
jgi:hypothetical protein